MYVCVCVCVCVCVNYILFYNVFTYYVPVNRRNPYVIDVFVLLVRNCIIGCHYL